MAQPDQPIEPPGAFGVEAAVRGLRVHIDERLAELTRLVQAGFADLERKNKRIMGNLQNLADLVTSARGDAQNEAQEVKTKLDEMTALIQQLQQNANDPAQVAAIAEDLGNLRGDIQGIFTGETPPGAKRRK